MSAGRCELWCDTSIRSPCGEKGLGFPAVTLIPSGNSISSGWLESLSAKNIWVRPSLLRRYVNWEPAGANFPGTASHSVLVTAVIFLVFVSSRATLLKPDWLELISKLRPSFDNDEA